MELYFVDPMSGDGDAARREWGDTPGLILLNRANLGLNGCAPVWIGGCYREALRLM